MSLVLLLALACQEPFGTDRHDLVGNRLVVGGRLWSDQAVGLRWYLVPSGDDDAVAALDPLDPPLAEGPWPALAPPAEPERLALLASYPDGSEDRAFLELPAGGSDLGALDVEWELLSGLDADTVEVEALDLDARAALATEPAEVLSPGAFARLSAELATTVDGLRARWMSVAGQGTWFELDDTTADWAAAEVVLDDDEVVERTHLDAGVATLLVLAGGTATRVLDLDVGDAPSTRAGSRVMPITPAPSGDAPWVRGLLVADDDSPTGLALEDAELVDDDDLDSTDPWGTRALTCAVALDGPFEPDWLVDGRCLRPEVDGHVVVMAR